MFKIKEEVYPKTEFISGKWNKEINVRDFIQSNYTPYTGDASFLAGPTDATKKLWNKCLDLFYFNKSKKIIIINLNNFISYFFCIRKDLNFFTLPPSFPDDC